MPSLYCECGGDGMVPAVYCNHEYKTLQRSLRGCPRCNSHGENFMTSHGDVLVDDEEVKRLLAGGYRFPGQDEERLAA